MTGELQRQKSERSRKTPSRSKSCDLFQLREEVHATEKTSTELERSSSHECKPKGNDSTVKATPTVPSVDPKQRSNETKEAQRKPAEQSFSEEEKKSEPSVSKARADHGVSASTLKRPDKESDSMEKNPARSTPKQEKSETEVSRANADGGASRSMTPDKKGSTVEKAPPESLPNHQLKTSEDDSANVKDVHTAPTRDNTKRLDKSDVALAKGESAKQGTGSVQGGLAKPTSVTKSQSIHTAVPGANPGQENVVEKARAIPTSQDEKFDDKLARFKALDAGSRIDPNSDSTKANVPVKSTSQREKSEGKGTFSIAPDARPRVNPKKEAAAEKTLSRSGPEGEHKRDDNSRALDVETRVNPEREINNASETQPTPAEPTTQDEEEKSSDPSVQVASFHIIPQSEKMQTEQKKAKKVHLESSKNRMTKCSARDCGIYRPLFNFTACAGCQSVFYCNATCQRNDWKYHSSKCASMKKAAK